MLFAAADPWTCSGASRSHFGCSLPSVSAALPFPEQHPVAVAEPRSLLEMCMAASSKEDEPRGCTVPCKQQKD